MLVERNGSDLVICAHRANKGCAGDKCMMFRLWPGQASDPIFVNAIKTRMKDAKEEHNRAVKYVMEHREEFGLPLEPTHGFCGLAGKPEKV